MTLTIQKRMLSAVFFSVLLMQLQGCSTVVGGMAGAIVAPDRRSSGAHVDDEGIEARSEQTLRNLYAQNIHVNIVSYNRVALLTGEVPTAAMRAEIVALISKIQNVREVKDELTLGANSLPSARRQDAWVTTKVKAALQREPQLYANDVKVVTEADVVYLMGLVNKSEANLASKTASQVEGVAKVVMLFEYLD